MEKPDKLQAYLDTQKESFAAAIEKAYIQGYKDAVEEQAKEYIKFVEDGVEYLDLGLPSGTLWALKSPRFVTFKESQKLNIPTKEQIQELLKFIRWRIYKVGNFSKFDIRDCDGRFYTNKVVTTESEEGGIYLWYRGDVDKDNNAPAYYLYQNGSCDAKIFPGYFANAYLVK